MPEAINHWPIVIDYRKELIFDYSFLCKVDLNKSIEKVKYFCLKAWMFEDYLI